MLLLCYIVLRIMLYIVVLCCIMLCHSRSFMFMLVLCSYVLEGSTFYFYGVTSVKVKHASESRSIVGIFEVLLSKRNNLMDELYI